MRRSIVLLSVSLMMVGAFGAEPALATGGRIDAHAVGYNAAVGTGILATAVCVAHTNPDPGWIVESTTVWCTINGFPSDTRTMDGGDAVVTNVNATHAPVTVCVYALATVTAPLGSTERLSGQSCVVTSAGPYG